MILSGVVALGHALKGTADTARHHNDPSGVVP